MPYIYDDKELHRMTEEELDMLVLVQGDYLKRAQKKQKSWWTTAIGRRMWYEAELAHNRNLEKIFNTIYEIRRGFYPTEDMLEVARVTREHMTSIPDYEASLKVQQAICDILEDKKMRQGMWQSIEYSLSIESIKLPNVGRTLCQYLARLTRDLIKDPKLRKWRKEETTNED